MWPFSRKKSEHALGLEITPHAVKMLELSLQDGFYRIESFAIVPLAPETMQQHTLQHPTAVTQAIKQARRQRGFSLMQAATAIPDAIVISKVVQCDAEMTENALLEQIQLDAVHYIPYSLDEAALDFTVLGVAENDPSKVDIYVVATRQAHVATRTDAIKRAALQPHSIDVASNALARACQLMTTTLPIKNKDPIIAVIDIQSTVLTCTVLHNAQSCFSHETAISSLTLESCVDLIRHTLQQFFMASTYNHVDYLILTGDEPSLPTWCESLQTHLAIPCSMAQPFGHMAVHPRVNLADFHAAVPALVVCCGLALRSFME